MKRKNGKEEAGNDVFYIGVHEPMDLRKNLLESARDSIQLLQRFEKLKTIREEKLLVARKLDNTVKEVRSLINQLKKILPAAKANVKLPARQDHTQPVPKQESEQAHESQDEENVHLPKQQSRPQPQPSRESELDKLENELEDIEGKLNNLS